MDEPGWGWGHGWWHRRSTSVISAAAGSPPSLRRRRPRRGSVRVPLGRRRQRRRSSSSMGGVERQGIQVENRRPPTCQPRRWRMWRRRRRLWWCCTGCACSPCSCHVPIPNQSAAATHKVTALALSVLASATCKFMEFGTLKCAAIHVHVQSRRLAPCIMATRAWMATGFLRCFDSRDR